MGTTSATATMQSRRIDMSWQCEWETPRRSRCLSLDSGQLPKYPNAFLMGVLDFQVVRVYNPLLDILKQSLICAVHKARKRLSWHEDDVVLSTCYIIPLWISPSLPIHQLQASKCHRTWIFDYRLYRGHWGEGAFLVLGRTPPWSWFKNELLQKFTSHHACI